MTRRVLFAVVCCASFLLTGGIALAQETTSPPASPSETETATETTSPSASPDASPSESALPTPAPSPSGSTTSSPSPSPSPTGTATTDSCPPGEDGQSEDDASEEPSEEAPGAAVTPPAPSPPGEEGDATTAQEEDPCPEPSASPETIAIDASSRPDGAEGGTGSDATLGDATLGGGFDSSGVTPSRVDAGGGYLARSRGDSGVGWLLLVPLTVAVVLLFPRLRAFRAR